MAYTGSVPDTAAHRLDWMERAACANEEDVFDDPSRDHEARTICVARCPVRAFCLAFTKKTEHGLHRHQRGGVAAGLTHEERYRLDTAARHSRGDPELIVFDGTERCGTRQALLRHLWLDEPIDGTCWSGEVHRGHGGRAPRRPAAADTP
ncbi:WhiB family transcriptional regulator [Streptomyces sp. NPDC102394]|uniref:WhiB family transcriptional regulator n=1 Tax=Streptomyces sp. NPDC102394 TaxID=3366167 RepID=UPI003823C2FB